ncbi:beta strand repeat-containing protein, partial [uncultured Nostoc sp.]
VSVDHPLTPLPHLFSFTLLDNLSSIKSQGLENSLGNTGNIAINAQSISLKNQSLINSDGSRSRGNIILNAKDNVSLDNNSFIGTSGIINSIGKSGDITITTRNINLSNQSGINSANIGQGQGGKITLKAQEAISLTGGSNILSASAASGFGGVNNQPSGDIEIKTRTLTLDGNNTLDGNSTLISSSNLDDGRGGDIQIVADDSILLNGLVFIVSSSTGQGDGGNIELQTREFTLFNGGSILTRSLGRGNSGDLLVNASDSVTLSGIATVIDPLNPQTGETITGGSGLTTSTSGTGNSGQLTINTERLSINDGGYITTTSDKLGRAGNLTINAKDSVEVVGRSPNSPSIISTTTSGSGDAGSLNISAGRLSIHDGAIVITSTFFGTGKGGDLTIDAKDSVEVVGGSFNNNSSILTTTFGSGDAGSLNINAGSFSIRDGAQVNSGTSGAGKAENLTVNVSGSVEVIGVSANGLFNSTLSTSANRSLTGNAGDLTINAQNILVRDGGQVNAVTSGQGKGGNLTVNATGKVELIGTSADGSVPSVLSTSALAGSTGDAGDLTIKAQDLFVRDGAQITAATSGRGKAGNLNLNASKKVELIGSSADGRIISGLAASVQQGSTGEAGSLTINTQDLLVRDGARVFTGTLGAGRAGNLTVNASNKVELIGTFVNGSPGGLIASAEQGSTGDAGDLKITTQNLLVRDGAQILTSTFSSGRGGNLTVNASESVQLIGQSVNNKFPSGLFVSAEPDSTGDAGDLQVDTQNLLISDRAGVFVNSLGTGNAGIMTINSDRIRLDNKASLNANTRSPNKDPNREQATINLNSQDLILRRNSNITTNATGKDVIGGNINIDTDFLIALENSDINANSTDFRGGQVIIAAQGIFGTEPRNALTPESDITATGASPDLSGTTDINTPDVDPTQGLIKLPEERIDTSNQIGQICPRGRYAKKPLGEFVVSGHGSLPPSPLQSITGTPNLIPLATLDGQTATPKDVQITPVINNGSSAIIEAQGFARTPEGKIIIVAYAPQATPSSRPTAAACPAPK